jgi:hypothetical protein|nr:hypothetical protein [Neorhizobium tomejilense]
MDHDVDASGGDKSVEGVQDVFLISQHRASIARDHLAEMMERQREQAEAVVTMIQSLREQLRISETARLTIEDENRRLHDRNAEIERQMRHVQGNYNRLADAYNGMMQVVENTHTSSVGLTQRIEAMLLQNDLGIAPRPHASPVRRLEEFREGAFAGPARQPHGDYDRRDYHPRGDYHARDGYGSDNQFTAYGSEGSHARPLSSLRNER